MGDDDVVGPVGGIRQVGGRIGRHGARGQQGGLTQHPVGARLGPTVGRRKLQAVGPAAGGLKIEAAADILRVRDVEGQQIGAGQIRHQKALGAVGAKLELIAVGRKIARVVGGQPVDQKGVQIVFAGQADGVQPVDQSGVLDHGLVKGDGAPGKGLDRAAVDGNVDFMIGVVGAQQGHGQGAGAGGPSSVQGKGYRFPGVLPGNPGAHDPGRVQPAVAFVGARRGRVIVLILLPANRGVEAGGQGGIVRSRIDCGHAFDGVFPGAGGQPVDVVGAVLGKLGRHGQGVEGDVVGVVEDRVAVFIVHPDSHLTSLVVQPHPA